MGLLHQLGGLFLQAAPTAVIVFLFYFFLKWAFFNPIQRVMALREKRTEGARAEADAAQAAAREKVQEHQDALKRARAAVYAEQDKARQAMLDERARLVRQAKERAAERVAAAKDEIAVDAGLARAQLEAQTPAIAESIVSAIFEHRPGPRPANEAR
jgi:F0F1-type ATP synthase membrane subunit b/b'